MKRQLQQHIQDKRLSYLEDVTKKIVGELKKTTALERMVKKYT
jgi:hypothetical protein